MIVSITPEIGIDEIPVYAGGLGVLEGDKFLEAVERGLEYTVLTFFYRRGYVYYSQDPEKILVETTRDFSEYRKALVREEPLTVSYDGREVRIEPLVYSRNKARIVYFEVTEPVEFREKLDRLYIEEDRYWFEAKYIILAKASYKYMTERIGLEKIEVVDLQESLASIVALLLPYTVRKRLVIHTPGPWGHPTISRETLAREVGYIGREDVLTRITSARVDSVVTVSEKHYMITKTTFPELENRLSYITNGVSIERWMHPEIKKVYRTDGIDKREFIEAHKRVKRELLALLREYKRDLGDYSDRPVVLWARRVTRYKRPYFMTRLIEDIAGGGHEVLFVLGGKAHPRDTEGQGYMKIFAELHREYRNVVYIHDYDIGKAKTLLAGSDLLLFTPFPGWEASGTSFMKSGVNGVPTIASRDGAALEMITDGKNGWLFGTEMRYPIDLYSQAAAEIDQRDYRDLYERIKRVLDLYERDHEGYVDVMINALRTFTEKASIRRVMSQYYPEHYKDV